MKTLLSKLCQGFVFLLCLVYPSPNQAQKLFQISLYEEPLEIPDRRFYIVEVRDKRIHTKTIGYLQKGVLNWLKFADFWGGFEPHLQTYLENKLPKTSEDQTPVRLNIYHLEIGENTSDFNESGWAQVSLGIEDLNPLKMYSKEFKHRGRLGNYGVDVTSGHPRRIVNALLEGLLAFNNTLARGGGTEAASGIGEEDNILREAELPDGGIDFVGYYDLGALRSSTEETSPKTKPVLKLVYADFQAVQEKKPVLTNFQVDWIDENRAHLFDPITGKKRKNDFCFYIGDDCFINAKLHGGGNQYVRVSDQGVFWLWLDDLYLSENQGHTIRVKADSKSLYCICLDTRTGQFTPLNQGLTLSILKENPVLQGEFMEMGANGKSPLVQLDFMKRLNQYLHDRTD